MVKGKLMWIMMKHIWHFILTVLISLPCSFKRHLYRITISQARCFTPLQAKRIIWNSNYRYVHKSIFSMLLIHPLRPSIMHPFCPLTDQDLVSEPEEQMETSNCNRCRRYRYRYSPTIRVITRESVYNGTNVAICYLINSNWTTKSKSSSKSACSISSVPCYWYTLQCPTQPHVPIPSVPAAYVLSIMAR